MPYADLDRVRRILDLEGAEGAEATAITADLTALNTSLSAIFEDKVGRSWSATPATARTEAIVARSAASGVLTLPPPGITELVSLTIGPEWDGSAWSGGEAVADLSEVVPVWRTDDGAYLGLQIGRSLAWPWSLGTWYGGVWTGTVLVEAIWADQGGAAPPEVTEALTFLVAEEYKAERASPESQLGMDGLSIPTRNPWRFQRVQAVIDKYRLPDRLPV